jgi:hypothetical protein
MNGFTIGLLLMVHCSGGRSLLPAGNLETGSGAAGTGS